MKLYLKQHIFTWGDRFTVYDADGNDCYYAEGEIFTWGKRLHLYSVDGDEAAYIQQKVFSFLPRYYISKNGVQIAEVVKEFTFFHSEYAVNGLGWTASGDFFSHEYAVYDGSETVAAVSKQWFTLGDAYEIDISAGTDVDAVLSVVLIIDACLSASD